MEWKKIKPVKKVELPALAGAISTFGWWLAGELSWTQDPPAAVVAASVVIVMAVVGWFAPPTG